MRLCALMVPALLLSLTAPAAATTIVVDVNGTGDYTAIAPAVAASSEGDTILVLPGTYTGEDNANIAGSHSGNFVLLADTSSRLPVIIDGGGTSTALRIVMGQNPSTIVSGFTIQNGYAQHGGGMSISSSSPTIENCTFLDNHAWSRGGAINIYASSSTISDCVFKGNSADNRGGAIYSDEFWETITGCLFEENVTPTDWTRGGAMFLDNGSETVVECTMVRNTPDNIMIYNGNGVDVANCIIAGATDAAGLLASPDTGGYVWECILFGNSGGDAPVCQHQDILYEDPRFCNSGVDDFTLCDDSSGLPANNVWSAQIGAYGSGCAACGSPVQDATWGSVKALFR